MLNAAGLIVMLICRGNLNLERAEIESDQRCNCAVAGGKLVKLAKKRAVMHRPTSL